MSSSTEPTTPPVVGDARSAGNRSTSMTQTHPNSRARRRHMKRTRSAPDCKHGVANKIKVGVCAMDKKAQSKPMSEILARLTAGGEFEVVTFGDKVILNEPVESWPLCDVLLSWHSEGFPLRKAQMYVELRRPFLINDVHSQDLLLDRRRVYKTLMDHNIPIPRHILVNREPAPVPEPSSETPPDIDELTTSSSSAGSTPQLGSTPQPGSSPRANSGNKAAAQAFKNAPPAPAEAQAAAATTAAAAAAAAAEAVSTDAASAGDDASTTAVDDAESGVAEEVLLDPPGFVEEEDYVELDGVRIDKPFVEKPVSGEDHNIHIYYPHSMGGGVKRLFRKVDNKSADYDPHHPGTVRRDGSYIYEEFLTTGGTDVKVYTVGPRYAHAEARKSPVVDGKVNRTPDGKEVRFPVLLSPQEKEIARMVCLAFGQRVCGFDLLRSETGRSYVCDVNGWSFVKNSKKYYDDAAGILRVMILSQLAPQRLTIAPEVPMPLSGLLEEVAAAQAATDDPAVPGPGSITGGSEDGTGLKMREPSISAAAQPAELGWEEQPSALAVDVDADGGMKEVGSLQDLTSLDGTYEEEGIGTDDSSSTAGVAASELSRNLELRCVLAVIRHGDRTPKQKMKVTVTQAPLIALYNKYKDSKGKQAKLKSPGQLQELLDVVRALLADMEAKSSSQRSSRSSTPAPGGQLSEEEKAQEQHEELREKLRIVRTVLEQGGTFAGINRKVQLKPTKWSTPISSKPSTPAAADSSEQQQQQGNAGDQQSQQQQQQSASQSSNKTQQGDGGGVRSARSSSTGGGAPAGGADGKPQVTELLLILKYGGVLTHAGRAQAEELGKTFRMVMYPRYGPAGGGGFLRLHSTYRHDLKIYSSDEGRVQMSAAAFIKGLLDLEGSSLTPILVSLVTKNASMLDAFGKGASDDILNAKNTLYQHLTWDPDKTVSLCSKLALPLATPAIGVTPPVSPKSTSAEDSHSPFHSGQRSSHTALDAGGGSGNVPGSTANSGVSTPTAAGAAHHSTSFGHEGTLPTTTSCLDLLSQGRTASGMLRRGHRASGTGSGSGDAQQQQQGSSTPRAGGGSSGSLVAAATANAAQLNAAGLSNLTNSASWSAVRAAEARAAALSHIKAMPDKPLVLLYQLVELMKVLVDQLREKCLEERVEATPHSQHATADKQDSGSDKSAGDKAAAGNDKAAGGTSDARSLQPVNSARGISSSRYSSLASSPDDWRLDETKPCSGERLLLMFDRWRKLLKSFYNEKKQQFDISKVPDIYDSAKYDAIHNSHLQLSSLGDLYRISRQLAAVVVPHEYGLDEQGKLLIGSKICSELLGKLMCDLESMKEESIVTAEIEAQTAAARTEEAAKSGSRHPSRQRVASHASLLDNANFDAFESEFGHMSVLDGRMRPPKPPVAPGSRLDTSNSKGRGANWGTAGAAPVRVSQPGTAAAGADGQQQQQQEEGGKDGGEQEEDRAEQETLHRLCPTYASDVNSPLRHVRTRIYFTSESHIHSLVNVLRYCHLLCPPGTSSSGLTSYGTAASNISKAPSSSNVPAAAAAVATAAVAGSGSSAAAAAAAIAVQPAADGTAVEAVTAAVAAVSVADAPAATAAGGKKQKGTAFASAAAAAAAAAAGGTAAADGSSGGEVLAAASSVTSSITGQQQQLLTPEGQTLLAGTDEFDYLTHIVFRMYENKMAPVDAPERFFVEIQFSNGANYDPTLVEPPRHTMPTQPRRLLTNLPGVPLQTFQELAGKYSRGKIAPCNYQLQYALRAPLSTSNTLSKAPTPGISRAGSANMGTPAAPTPPLPPRPPSPVPLAAQAIAAGAGAAATQLLVAGPGAAPSAPLPLSTSVAAAAAAAVAAERKNS